MKKTIPTEPRKAAATDPVCGMEVDPAAAPARFEHGGRTYFFCCEHCRAKFAAAPEAYRAGQKAS